jgi:hypothetical protein
MVSVKCSKKKSERDFATEPDMTQFSQVFCPLPIGHLGTGMVK